MRSMHIKIYMLVVSVTYLEDDNTLSSNPIITSFIADLTFPLHLYVGQNPKIQINQNS